MKDFRRLFFYLKPYLPFLFLALLLLSFAGLLEVLTTSLAAPIFDGVLSEGGVAVSGKFKFLYKWLNLNSSNILWKVGLALVALTLLKGVSIYFSNYLMHLVGQSVIMKLRNALYRHIMEQSPGFFASNPTGRLISRVTGDVEKLQEAVSSTLAEFVRESVLLFFLLGYVFYIHWKLALLALLILPPALYSSVNLGRRIRRASSRSQERAADIAHALQETISGHRIVKAFGREPREIERFERATRQLLSANLKSARILALSSPLMELMGVICFVPLLAYAHHTIRQQEALTIGAFSAFLFGLFRMYDPIRKLSRIHVQFQQAFAASSRVFELLDARVEISDRPGARTLGRVRGDIEFRDVCFDYKEASGRVRALRNINLKARAGQVIALVGSSGSGKTTLVNLIPRFYEITSGAILIDGIDIRDVTLSSLRRQIGFVTQETFLFNDSVRNNIAYSCPAASEDEIVQAAKAALAHDFITKLPQGYDTVIGERGQRLSGGERQRISIARALLKNAPILILDEATSALDAESERLVQQALSNLMKGRTTFVIAHRLSTVRMADLIVVLENGEIKEIGGHSELLGGNGIYSRLYQLEFSDEVLLAEGDERCLEA